MTSVYERSARLKVLPLSVAQLFDFTEEESALCLGLVQGKSLSDIADECDFSRVELRAQFKSLLTKTGADSIAKLVVIVLRSAEINRGNDVD